MPRKSPRESDLRQPRRDCARSDAPSCNDDGCRGSRQPRDKSHVPSDGRGVRSVPAPPTPRTWGNLTKSLRELPAEWKSRRYCCDGTCVPARPGPFQRLSLFMQHRFVAGYRVNLGFWPSVYSVFEPNHNDFWQAHRNDTHPRTHARYTRNAQVHLVRPRPVGGVCGLCLGPDRQCTVSR
jgi:hypothetical protein